MKKALIVRPARMRPGYLDAYEAALRAAGILPIVVPPDQNPAIEGLDGLLLIGGSDVNAELYGQKSAPEAGEPDDVRDAAELKVLTEALERDVPVLAICRGMQILNVQHGGTLVQHLKTTDRHQPNEPDHSKPIHPVAIEPQTRLAEVIGSGGTIEVNSRHHQAIDRLGSGLKITARDPADGTVEAVERLDKPFVIGVQWHPEDQSPKRPDQARLFRAFADAMP